MDLPKKRAELDEQAKRIEVDLLRCFVETLILPQLP
jgi:hypothetical protein